MAVKITEDMYNTFTSNGFTEDDIKATVGHYRSQGQPDSVIFTNLNKKYREMANIKDVSTPQIGDQPNYDEILNNPALTPQEQASQIKLKGEAYRSNLDKDLAVQKAKMVTGAGIKIASPLIGLGLAPFTAGMSLPASMGALGALEGGAFGVGEALQNQKKGADFAKEVGLQALTGGLVGGVQGALFKSASKYLPKALNRPVKNETVQELGQLASNPQKYVANTKRVVSEMPIEQVKTPTGETQLNAGLVANEAPIATMPQIETSTKTAKLGESLQSAKGLPANIKKALKGSQYDSMTNEEVSRVASEAVDKDLMGNYADLMSKNIFDAYDVARVVQISKRFNAENTPQAHDLEQALFEKTIKNSAKMGQGVQAFSLLSNLTPEGAVYRANKLIADYNKKFGKSIKLTPEQTTQIRTNQETAFKLPDGYEKDVALAKSLKYVQDIIPKRFGQKLKAYRNISLLLNPKTLGRNIVGNSLFNSVDAVSKTLAVPIDKAIGAFTKQRTRALPQIGEQLKGFVQGGQKGYKEAIQGIDTKGLGGRFDLQGGRIFKGGNKERVNISDIINTPNEQKKIIKRKYIKELITKNYVGQALSKKSFKPLLGYAKDIMPNAETALNVGLKVPDRAFYEATYAESIANQLKASGLKTPTQKMYDRAEKEALESVFQDKSKLSEVALGVRNQFNKIGTKEFGLGDLIIPYAQTPANLAQQGINYSPAGLVKGIVSLAKGDQRQASLDIARALIGTGIGFGGYQLAKNGMATGNLETGKGYVADNKLRNNLQELGIRPNQIGDVNYSQFQPMSIPLSVGIATAEGQDPLKAGVNTLLDLQFMENYNRLVSDVKAQGLAQAGANFAGSIPSQFVPTGLGQVNQYFDNSVRDTYSSNKFQQGLNRAGSKIPFVAQNLPEKVGVTGKTLQRYSSQGARKGFDVFLNPTFINKKTNDEVITEMNKIYKETGDMTPLLPVVQKNIKINGVQTKLNAKQVNEYQKDVGKINYYLRKKAINDDNFKQMNSEEKIKYLKSVTSSVNQAVKIMRFKDNPSKYQPYTKDILDNYDQFTKGE